MSVDDEGGGRGRGEGGEQEAATADKEAEDAEAASVEKENLRIIVCMFIVLSFSFVDDFVIEGKFMCGKLNLRPRLLLSTLLLLLIVRI